MNESNPTEYDNPNNEQDLIAIRREKLVAWREKNQAYPNTFQQTHFFGDLYQQYAAETESTLATLTWTCQVAGRILTRRLMGKASFIHLQDMTGKLQVYVRADQITPAAYEDFKHWDIGDIVGVTGHLFKTKTGELSIKAENLVLLSKALRPLPDKFHGLQAIEARYRQRYLDLIMNEESKKIFTVRASLVEGIRQFLLSRRFMEVETPMMQIIPGGAAAKPFITHHHALKRDLYLRIAPELYLKRLVVGGFERVFEINRNFRNEGLSTRHNPEFTMLEFYQAYANYKDLMDLTEELFQVLAKKVFASSRFTYQEIALDFSKPFERLTLFNAVLKYAPDLSAETLANKKLATAYAEKQGLQILKTDGLGKIQNMLFEHFAEEQLQQPTFITAYPKEISPLARCNDQDPFITDRFELFIAGREIANGFSELNDPEEQAARFQEQAEQKQAGDPEAMFYDDDYIQALEYGLPPTAGEGIGIDRLVMLFTNVASIKDVILFPHMRPKKE